MSAAAGTNGHVSKVRGFARQLLKVGRVPIPNKFRDKKPIPKEWEKIRVEGFDLDDLFPPSQARNIGVSLGAPSGGLVDDDNDCPEMRTAAGFLMLDTGMVWGRKPNSHRGYVTDHPPDKATEKFFDPTVTSRKKDEGLLGELRSTGGQTLLPPSVLPADEDGQPDEPVVWQSDGPPAFVPIDELMRAMRATAAAALLGRHWPASGGRHDSALALAGGLLRLGMSVERAEVFVRAVCTVAGDEDIEDNRVAGVGDTKRKIDAGDKDVTGWPTLAGLIGSHGEVIVRQVREWLGARIEASPKDYATPEPPRWPDPLHEAAFHGLAGDIVRVIEPATEADPAAVLAHTLIYFGNVIGRKAYFRVGSARHYANEYAVVVARSSKGRKGTAAAEVHPFFEAVDEEWATGRVLEGLSSGEGLIWAVRDPIEKKVPIKEKGRIVDYQTEVVDDGEADKRLLVTETEFANVLKQTERLGNTLSPVARKAWDKGNLRSLTKNSPAKATDAHVSIIGHITVEELTRYLSATESANGFGNRFMWFVAQRSKLLPDGGRTDPKAVESLHTRLREAVRFAGTVEEVSRDNDARDVWHAVYGKLSADRPGLAGCLLGRAEAHVVRLALIYALLDSSAVVRAEHLLAALAVWDYVEASVLVVFGDNLGDPLADDLMRLIRQAGDRGVTRTDISGYLGNNVKADKINRALGLLLQYGRARMAEEETGGRKAERWFAERR